MASAMAAAAAHSIPPFPLPPVPRVRPPPIPKGTPGPNTIPAPGPPPRSHVVWVDGEWREKNSAAALHKVQVTSRQLEKALKHKVHGMNIYAYKHIRTKQVIYSLTKNMDNNRALRQLLFHGKKTVPAALRRDVWRPYFSIHFPQTPAGAYKGLRVFQELRELSMKRQLDPPKSLTHTTEEEVEKARKDSKTQAEMTKPILGAKLPQTVIARRLMNQQASSVADVAAVLSRWSNHQLHPSRKLAISRLHKAREEEGLSARAAKRLTNIREQEAEKTTEIEERTHYLESRPDNLSLDKHTRSRTSLEYDGDLAFPGAEFKHLKLLEQAQKETDEETGATLRYEKAKSTFLDEKSRKLEAIDAEMTANIDRRIAEMPASERSQVLDEIQTMRDELQKKLELEISQKQDEFRREREEARAQYAKPLRGKHRAFLHSMKNRHSQIILDMKLLAKRQIKHVGPYAEIEKALEETEKRMDQDWARMEQPLRKARRKERGRNLSDAKREVEIRWADIRDGLYAQEWPMTVYHTELQAKAVASRGDNTVHVFGSDIPEQLEVDQVQPGRYVAPAELEGQSEKSRLEAIGQQAKMDRQWNANRMVELRKQAWHIETSSGQHPPASEIPRLQECLEQISYVRSDLDLLLHQSPSENQLSYFEDSVKWLQDSLPLLQQECQASVAERPNFEWAEIQTQLLDLESKHIAAMREVNPFFEVLSRRVDLMKLHATATDADLRERAITNIANFDEQHPYIADVASKHEPRSLDLEDTDASEPSSTAASRPLQPTERLQKIAETIDMCQEQLDDPMRDDKPEIEARIRELNQDYTAVVEQQIKDFIQSVNSQMFEKYREFEGVSEDVYGRVEDDVVATSSSAAAHAQADGVDDIVVPKPGFWGRIKGALGL